MKAAVLHAFGQSPAHEDVPVPEPGEGEELIKVTAASLKPSPRTSREVLPNARVVRGARRVDRDLRGVISVAGGLTALGVVRIQRQRGELSPDGELTALFAEKSPRDDNPPRKRREVSARTGHGTIQGAAALGPSPARS